MTCRTKTVDFKPQRTTITLYRSPRQSYKYDNITYYIFDLDNTRKRDTCSTYNSGVSVYVLLKTVAIFVYVNRTLCFGYK